MVEYRRSRLPGGTYFFTVTLANRRARTLVEQIDILRASVADVAKRHPFTIDAMVVLPDHLHAIWTLPDGDADYSARWRLIKSGFSRAVAGAARPRLWQARFWEHTIRGDQDFRHHVEYVWFNPVRHGYVAQVGDWPHSSFHRDVRRGLVPSDWGGGATAPTEREHGYGE